MVTMGRNVVLASARHTGPMRGDSRPAPPGLRGAPSWRVLARWRRAVRARPRTASARRPGRDDRSTAASTTHHHGGHRLDLASGPHLGPVAGRLTRSRCPSRPTAVTAAESPDGAVFASPQDPTSSSTHRGLGGRRQRPGRRRRAHRRPASPRWPPTPATSTWRRTRTSSRSTAPVATRTGSGTMPPVNAANSSDDDLVSLTAAAAASSSRSPRTTPSACTALNPRRRRAPPARRGLGAAVGTDGSIYYESDDHHLAGAAPHGDHGYRTRAGRHAQRPRWRRAVPRRRSPAGASGSPSRPARGSMPRFTTYDACTLADAGSYSGSVTDIVADTAAGPSCSNPAAAVPPRARRLRRPPRRRASPDRRPWLGQRPGAASVLRSPCSVRRRPPSSSDTATDQFEVFRLS